jgi:hypothetical protein
MIDVALLTADPESHLHPLMKPETSAAALSESGERAYRVDCVPKLEFSLSNVPYQSIAEKVEACPTPLQRRLQYCAA